MIEVYQYDGVKTLLRNVNRLLPQPCPTTCTVAMLTMTNKVEYDWLNEYIRWRASLKKNIKLK